MTKWLAKNYTQWGGYYIYADATPGFSCGSMLWKEKHLSQELWNLISAYARKNMAAQIHREKLYGQKKCILKSKLGTIELFLHHLSF